VRFWGSVVTATDTTGRPMQHWVGGQDVMAMATVLDTAVERIREIQHDAHVNGKTMRPRRPMIVLKSPKGWTGPEQVDGVQIEGTLRAHQIPTAVDAEHPEHLKLRDDWLKSYRLEELLDESVRLLPELAELAPKGTPVLTVGDSECYAKQGGRQ
jgi:phosphoketolase